MANTRQSAKRARQEKKREARNLVTHTKSKTALKKALMALGQKEADLAKEAYQVAVKELSRAASKGVLPRTRAARKISRLTKKFLTNLPSALPFQLGTAAAKSAKKTTVKSASKAASK